MESKDIKKKHIPVIQKPIGQKKGDVSVLQQSVEVMNDYSVEHMREIMVRNDFYLPPKKCQWTTKKLMTHILLGSKYCPKYVDVKIRPCPVPPPKVLIIREVCKEIAEKVGPHMVWTINIRYGPDVEWLMHVLSTLNPNHEFFSKSYYPSRQLIIP